MNRGNFTDNISLERMADLIDKTLAFEKNNKNRTTKTDILKILPAAAAVVLCIGFFNLPDFTKNQNNPGGYAPGAAVMTETAEPDIINQDSLIIRLETSETNEINETNETETNRQIWLKLPLDGYELDGSIFYIIQDDMTMTKKEIENNSIIMTEEEIENFKNFMVMTNEGIFIFYIEDYEFYIENYEKIDCLREIYATQKTD